VCQTTPYLLTGPQCLVFFLGGVAQANPAGGWTVWGTSKNPANPFLNPASSFAGAKSRHSPLYEFKNDRLHELPKFASSTKSLPQPPGGFPGYCDSLGVSDNPDFFQPFYVYFSAYGGTGYDPDDFNMDELNDQGTANIFGGFMTANSPIGVQKMGRVDFILSQSPNPYTKVPPTRAPRGRGPTRTRRATSSSRRAAIVSTASAASTSRAAATASSRSSRAAPAGTRRIPTRPRRRTRALPGARRTTRGSGSASTTT
jgi:hypothetical protein